MKTPFEPTGTLPPAPHTLLLEASAGTGKTHTIAALAVRLIAEEGVAAQDLLIVTFTRGATAELRERIRRRLAHTLDVLDGTADPLDDVDRHLVALPHAPQRARLRDALMNFDATSISTVHVFCSRAMQHLGVLGEKDPGESLLEDVTALANTAAVDTFVNLAADPAFGLTPTAATARAQSAVADGQSDLDVTGLPDPGSDPGLAQRFAQAARTRAESIRRGDGLVSYDDQILRLRQVLEDSPAAAQAAEVLRRRFPVVLVDEFQDTDEAQWAVLQELFHGHSRLVLIGDPKQAIYAFRGGDVNTYNTAAQAAAATRTLATNYRSDPGVVAGVNLLFGTTHLSVDPPIGGEPMEVHHTPRLRTATGEGVAAFCGRVLDRDGRVDDLRAAVADDTADQIVATLQSGWQVEQDGRMRPIEASHVAVLTRTGGEGHLVAQALRARGVPCRETSSDSVVKSAAARDWLALLRALADPGYPARGTAAALALLGGSPAQLGADPDGFAEEYGARLRQLRELVDRAGFPSLAGAVLADETAMCAVGDDRRLADLRHVAEILGAQQRSSGMSVSALADWLAAQMGAPTRENPQHRESDAPAVVVMTVHAAKGLQFPIVFVPFAWDGRQLRDSRFARIHRGGSRRLDVREPCAGLQESQQIGDAEDADEEMRLLYVALTRAAHRVVWHWAWLKYQHRTERSSLHRILGAAAAGDARPEPGYERDAWQDWARATPEIDICQVVDGAAVMLPDTGPAPQEYAAAQFTRELDRDWRRRSFSSITRAAHEAAFADRVTVDEPDDPLVQEDGGSAPTAGLISPWTDLPSGTGFGTMVHHILEVTDGDRIEDLAANCRDALARFRVAGVADDQLAEALRLTVTTPLGPLVGNADLTAFGKADRAAELDFEIALDVHSDGGATTLAQLAEVLAADLPEGHPLAGYPERLGDLAGDLRLRGFLSGQIDAVLRWESPNGPTYLVADYKTNWLGPWGSDEVLTTSHYRADALARAMMDSHYPLQALLYCVALHRHLRWRLGPSYDPQRSLGGVLYLFLRGMVGPDTPPDTGVFTWRPSAALVTRVSDLLSGVTGAASGDGGVS